MAIIKKRNEDPADQWLREHDPYYTDKSRGKKLYLKYPYLTPDQEVARARMEIPISSIGSGEKEITLDYLGLLEE